MPLCRRRKPASLVKSVAPVAESKKNISVPELKLSGYGDLKIYGDVEFNMDAESKRGLLAMTNADVGSDPTYDKWDLNGRILLGFDGIHKTDNSYLAGFLCPAASGHNRFDEPRQRGFLL